MSSALEVEPTREARDMTLNERSGLEFRSDVIGGHRRPVELNQASIAEVREEYSKTHQLLNGVRVHFHWSRQMQSDGRQ